jgi:site-specific recombinase XerD
MLTVISNSTNAIERELSSDPRLSYHSRRAYLSDLRSFQMWRSHLPLTRQTVELYTVHLKSSELSPLSINRKLSAIRWWVRRMKIITYDSDFEHEKLEIIRARAQGILELRGVKGSYQQVGKHITDEQVKTLVSSCPPDLSGLRDAALFSTAWAAGLRRAEIANLQLSDLTIGDCIEIRVLGKGDKVRTAYLFGSAMTSLLKWLQKRGNQSGPVFCRIRKDSRMTNETLSGEGMAHILERRLEGLDLDITWHDFRRTFVGRLLDNGVDLVTVQGMAGHASPAQTAKYDRRGDRAKRAAAQLMEMNNG